MKTRHHLLAITLAAALGAGLSLPALALGDAARQQLEGIQARWAEVNYKLPDKQREAAFADLAQQAAQAVTAEPAAAELRIWHGIVLSTYAGAKGGLGALDLVKKAKAELEEALKLDPKALDGSAYTSLGSLYYQVPGWPLGFGDKTKARELLQRALQINPDGIDPNYFYGDFLYRNGDKDAALAALNKALAAAPRPDQPVADQGRREQIRALINTITTSH